MLDVASMKRILFFLSCFLLLASGFSFAGAPAPINDVYVVHFVLDGMNRGVFDKLLDEGKLPAIKEHFVDHGAVFEDALSNFPSTSPTIYQSYVTGLLPGNSGIPHLERFDRKNKKTIGYLSTSGYLKINDDLINLKALENPDTVKLQPPTTIYELLGGHPTFALYSSFRRGASDFFPKRVPMHALWSAYVTENGLKIDYLAYEKLFGIFGEKDIPRYTLVGLYSVDFLEHEFGIKSVEAKNAVTQFDIFLREFLELLKKQGIADKTYLIVSADHGMHDTGKLFKLEKSLLNAGIFVKPGNPKIKDYTLYAADRGISSTHIYIKHDGGWEPVEDADILRSHPKKGGGTVDLIQTLLDLEPTMLVIARDGGRAARIFDAHGGQSRIECYNLNSIDWCSYHVTPNHGDPLHYYGRKNLAHLQDGEPHSTFEWKKATVNEEYPDAVIQLSQIFHDGRAGDLFVIPKSEWGFRKAKAATHGSIIFDDMRVPMLISGPTVPAGKFGVIRSCDIYPLLLKWFGINVPKNNYDGVDPFEKIEPESKEWQQLATLEQTAARGGKVRASGRMAALAREELNRRQILLKKLKAYEMELIRQPLKNDHVDIVRRAIELTEERVKRMQEITNRIL